MKYKEYHKLLTLLGRRLPAGAGAGAEAWARMAAFAGVVAVGTALAQLTWRFFPAPPEETAPTASTLRQQAGGALPLSISELTEGHLFGLALLQPGGAINAPETTLDLTLRGIVARSMPAPMGSASVGPWWLGISGTSRTGSST